MKAICLCFSFMISVVAVAQNSLRVTAPNKRTDQRIRLFDDGWKFYKGEKEGAEQTVFDDRQWRQVDLPHDWSVEDLPMQIPDSISGPFTRASVGATATGYVEGGTGWYRKTFTLTGDAGKNLSICFDGVYMNADVWLNGHHLGNHPYGYTAFYFELTPWLKPMGQKNLLAVRVRNIGKNSRWYSGSGIYRHVWLVSTGSLHIPIWGVYVTTPQVSSNEAQVNVVTSLKNDDKTTRDATIETVIISPEGMVDGKVKANITIQGKNSSSFSQTLNITKPFLWSPESPRLYKAISHVYSNNKLIDSTETVFGIRTVKLDAENGFVLNGEKIELRGGCIHHDYGPLGAAAIDRAEERKIELLKSNGYNAIRLSHNPPSKVLLDACDRLGMLVIDEAFDMWERAKNPEDYHKYFTQWWKTDLDAMLLRDRNHPSIIFWSIGNEINERADTSGLAIASRLIKEVKQIDPTRPVTEAICAFWDHPGQLWETTAPAFALLDVGGYNYQWRTYETDHKSYPQRIMMGTESVPKEAFENWQMVEKHPYVIGDFVWTAVDYMGETAIGHTLPGNLKDSFSLGWPWFASNCGDIDLAGYKKPQSYYRDIVWHRTPIAMAVHRPLPEGIGEQVSYWGWPDEMQSWTWPGNEGRPMQVRVFSRSGMVKLFLNDELIGEKEIPDSSITAVFEVPYHPGKLKAVAIQNGKDAGSIIFETAGNAKQLRLTADRDHLHADRNDLSYITVEVLDEHGRLVPDAAIPVHFNVSGAGEIAGVVSGDPKDVSSFQKPVRKSFRGRCVVIIRPKVNRSGKVVVKVDAQGLSGAETTLIIQ